MSYLTTDATLKKNNLQLAYDNLKSSVQQNSSKLNSDSRNKVENNLFPFATSVYNVLLDAYSKEKIVLNSVQKVNMFIFYCSIYTSVFNSWATRIYDLANLPADCANVKDYKVEILSENNIIKKLIRKSPTKSECQFTLLENLGNLPSTTFDPATQKITTEITLKSLDLGSLGLPYSDEDKRTIKNFISGIAGLDTGIITNIKMLNTNDNNNLVAQISFDTSFTNTIPGSYSLPIKSNYSIIKPKSAEITVRLIDANIVLPSKFSGDFNISYLQDITKFSNIFK